MSENNVHLTESERESLTCIPTDSVHDTVNYNAADIVRKHGSKTVGLRSVEFLLNSANKHARGT